MIFKPLFDILVVLYLFFGGAAAGSFLVMSVWSLSFHRTDQNHHYRLKRAFKFLMARSYTISFILLVFSVLCLLWDLGAPERAISLFLRPHATVLTFGSFALLFQIALGAFLSIVNVFDLSLVSGKVRKACEILCCIGACAVIVYTGIFLATNTSVPFWNTWTLVALFIVSSLSAGVSLVLLTDWFVKDQTLLLRAARPLQKTHIVILLLEALILVAFVASAVLNPAAEKSVQMLLSPEVLPTAIIGIIVMGIVVPLILETYSIRRRECRTIPVSDVICLFGVFFLRYIIILCGVH